jgi:hypothetical protein
MAFAIANEHVDNHLFFFSSFLLGFLYTLCNLHALVLQLLELIDEVVVPIFALSSLNTRIYLLKLLGI